MIEHLPPGVLLIREESPTRVDQRKAFTLQRFAKENRKERNYYCAASLDSALQPQASWRARYCLPKIFFSCSITTLSTTCSPPWPGNYGLLQVVKTPATQQHRTLAMGQEACEPSQTPLRLLPAGQHSRT